ncbi:unnamed protein product [Dibothriocephalus latus]|uniref:C2H2-type domain-containing protein n=1 Tax=Dibothriocephalus latus TaxID=60516 RepID=A0A3P6T697_DIBLA|nr:unnamed protein product [Dibothriocephalus latus]
MFAIDSKTKMRQAVGSNDRQLDVSLDKELLEMAAKSKKKTLDLFYQCKNKLAPKACTDDEFVQTMLLQIQKFPNPSQSIANNSTEFVCPECDFVAGSMSDISAHFDLKHSVEASFSCTCGSSYDRMPDFLRHYITCPTAATDLQDPSHSKASDPPKALKAEAAGNGNSPENTETDSTNFFSTYRHPPVVPIKGPSNEKPFGCPQCPKGFKSKSLLEQHMHLHYPPRYKCRWCGKVYRWPPVYYHHMRICKKLPSSKSNHLPHPEVDSTPKAESYFAHVSNCSQVLKTLRGRYSNLPPTDFSPLPSSLDSKLSVPLKPELQSPEPRISHRSSKVFICSICSKGFTSKLSLKQHMDGKHRAEGKYVCQVCGKRYRWGASFYYHRRTFFLQQLMRAGLGKNAKVEMAACSKHCQRTQYQTHQPNV